MSRFFFMRAQIRKGAQVANGILLRKEGFRSIAWVSNDTSWLDLHGGVLSDFAPYHTYMTTWALAHSNDIMDVVNKWNNNIREPSAIAEVLEGTVIHIPEGEVEREWTSPEWDVTFDDLPPLEPLPPADDEFMSDRYSMDRIYTGQKSYHAHHGERPNMPLAEFKGHRIGVELEVECKSSQDLTTVKGWKSNWFYQERDGSLGSYGDEFITIPLLPKDAKCLNFWRPVIERLSKHAYSWNRRTCGLHVHIGRECLGKTPEQCSETLGKLLYFYHHIIGEDDAARMINEKIFGRAEAYNARDGKSPVGNAVGVLGRGKVLKSKEICDDLKKAMISSNSGNRYYDINLENSATIEFRKGRGSISAERITAVVAWCEGMVDYCRMTGWLNLGFTDFVEWIHNRRGTPVSLMGFLTTDR